MEAKSQLRRIYRDILAGVSLFSCELGAVYIKHATSLDNCDSDIKYQNFYTEIVEKGLPTEAKKLAYLAKKKLWTEKDEIDLNELSKYAGNLKITKSKIAIPSQRDALDVQIKDAEFKYRLKQSERDTLIGLTAESMASQKTNEFYLRQMSFKDPEFKTPLFTNDEYEDDIDITGKIIGIFVEFNKLFSQELVKRVALLPLFMNAFTLCDDNPFTFYGKPIVHLTSLQTSLFGYGMQFRHIISESGDKLPLEFLEDPDKLLDWHESSNNTKELMSKQNDSGNISLVGATKEDYKKLGLEGQLVDQKALREKAKAKGGQLSMKDLMAMEGL